MGSKKYVGVAVRAQSLAVVPILKDMVPFPMYIYEEYRASAYHCCTQVLGYQYFACVCISLQTSFSSLLSTAFLVASSSLVALSIICCRIAWCCKTTRAKQGRNGHDY